MLKVPSGIGVAVGLAVGEGLAVGLGLTVPEGVGVGLEFEDELEFGSPEVKGLKPLSLQLASIKKQNRKSRFFMKHPVLFAFKP